MFTREQLETKELNNLANYACFSSKSEGRIIPEKNDEFRTCFQRDRDRIIHSKAFRRLKGKTQVFVSHHGDHYRSRLTHTMEVAQIARDMARTLGLNEDLAESIALAHDLGHTPFGHAGEEALNKKMQEHEENFEHNQESLRVVKEIERRSDDYLGLNLSYEVLEGMGKHETHYDKVVESGALPSLEAQIVNLADEIAYHNHDLDDGLRSKIFSIESLKELKIWKNITEHMPEIPSHDSDIWIKQFVSKLIHTMVSDVYKESARRIEKSGIKNYQDIRKQEQKLVAFSSDFYTKNQELKTFLFQNFYRHSSVVKMNKEGQKILSELFDFFIQNPQKIPKEYRQTHKESKVHFQVRDYLAGMTDNFAEDAYKELIS